MNNQLISTTGIEGKVTMPGYQGCSLLYSLQATTNRPINTQPNGVVLMRWLILLIASIVLTACGDNEMKEPPNTGIYAPDINPNPRYFMTVQGYIDPALNNLVQLTIIATYYTTNPKCDYTVDSWAGVSAYRVINKPVVVKTDNTGHYKYRIPLDLYKPAFCGWEIDTIAYKIDNSVPDYNAYIIAFFSKKGRKPENNIAADNWICLNNQQCDIQKQIYFKFGDNLSSNKNYIFNINFSRNR